MRSKGLIVFLVIAILAVACASTDKRRSLGQVVDDEFIALNLRTKFMKDDAVPANDILISVWKGVVTLKGEMTAQEQINRAIEIAERQKGVKEVKAYLVLKEFGRLREEPGRRAPKGSFFKKIFRSRGEKKPRNLREELEEKNLDVESGAAGGDNADGQEGVVAVPSTISNSNAPSAPNPAPQTSAPSETDDMNLEEEF